MEESRIIPIRPFPDRDRSPLSARPDMELNIRKIIYLRSKIRIKTYYWTQCILPNPNTISIILIRIFRPYHIGLIGVRTRITKLIPYVIRQTSFTSSQLMRKSEPYNIQGITTYDLYRRFRMQIILTKIFHPWASHIKAHHKSQTYND